MLKLLLVVALCVNFASCDTLFFRPFGSWGAEEEKDPPNPTCPDKQGTCPQKSTCCKKQDGKYGCCPLPNAVCCSDLTHCCPQGFVCDLPTSTCVSGNLVIDWLQHIRPVQKSQPGQGLKQEPASRNSPGGNDVPCPRGKVVCPSGNTCCMLDQSYGCCPMAEAVCCTDHKHCCPKGYKCTSQSCSRTQGKGTAVWMNLVSGNQKVKSDDSKEIELNTNPRFSPILESIKKEKPTANNVVVCPGGQFQCPAGNTCCRSTSGGWGCCPHVQAACCKDGKHCCPKGEQCNLAKGTCDSGTKLIPLFTKTEAVLISSKPSENKCPDNVSTCPTETTCCKMKNGYYGCCQYDQALCCDDNIHCCPKGMTCNSTTGTCGNEEFILNFGDPLSAMRPVPKVTAPHECPDKTSCPEETTCCEMPSGGYGCCPYQTAQCCADKIHCCPPEETCDVEKGSCIHSVTKIHTLFKDKIAAIPKPELFNEEVENSEKNTLCPDGKTSCLRNSTCCSIGQGYGCCPLPKAVCCSDRAHCCPNGYKCSSSTGTCEKDDHSITWVKKLPGLTINEDIIAGIDVTSAQLNNVICPDKQSECQSGSTCCLLGTGEYGCCPYKNASCCSDHIHCCPMGYKCDAKSGTCLKTSGTVRSVPWFTKRPAFPRQMTIEKNIICPDQSTCDVSSSCCKTMSGSYGCCPLPNAVCCSDGIHCCPDKSVCDVKAGRCLSTDINSLTTSWYTVRRDKKPMFESEKVKSTDVICPGGKVKCGHDNTCCLLSTGTYGCCPLPAAVCCSDGQHCCPHGSKCDTSTGICQSPNGDVELPNYLVWGEITLADKKIQDRSVVCPDHKSECPDGQTCCKISSQEYGCCPEPSAVCCADMLHCCPRGTTCNPIHQTCSSNNAHISMPWEWHLIQGSSTPVQKNIDVDKVGANDITCPDKKSQCPHDETCCERNDGSYGCCPLPAAVCCKDKTHCCPHKTICDPVHLTCNATKDYFSKAWNKNNHIRLIRKEDQLKSSDIICPDKTSQCHDNETCCQSKYASHGEYACCPMTQGVCCADQLHCCPKDTVCDTKAMTCNTTVLSNRSISWKQVDLSNAENARSRKTNSNLLNAIQCPDKSECPWDSTCCKSAGKYTCCTGKDAMCCSDNMTCCPSGFTCAVIGSKTSCKKAGTGFVVEAELHVRNFAVDMVTTSVLNKNVHAETIPWKLKVAANTLGIESPVSDAIICPDRKHECPNYTTCCKMGTTWGCCPMVRGVCCSDGRHCCPFGYVCDSQHDQCVKLAPIT